MSRSCIDLVLSDYTQREKALLDAQTQEELAELHHCYLSKKSDINKAFGYMKTLDVQEKKELGPRLAQVKSVLQNAYNTSQEAILRKDIDTQLREDIVDIHVAVPACSQGYYSLLTQMRRRMEQVCKEMGFVVEYGHSVVSKYENFQAVNIPLTHPATEMHDTIFLEKKDERGEEYVMRTHTTAIENGVMHKYGAPLRVVLPGMVYRYEDVDATHDTAFFQLEGMVIDRDISLAHLKSFLVELLSAAFGMKVSIRMRPGYFPFTEPGLEIDASCPACAGTGYRGSQGCPVCKQTGWIEILGAGMLHPHVLEQGGIDPDAFSGFAFGIGINRVVAIKYGITDIRYFTNGDLRFAQSFGAMA